MADKKPPSGGGRDRAKRINSLHNRVDGMIKDQDKKRLQVSSEINSLTNEQQKLMQQLSIEQSEFTNETAAAYNGVVKSLGKTIQNLSVGVATITSDTAKATAGAIGQYGKAIGEDISVNKQNSMVMAMSRATPLFGYFAAKFMETDVFQQSAKKIKDQVSGTLSKAGESLGNVFKKKQSENLGAATAPKLQEGGYIKKGGMIEVHAAEVVTPVDKLLDKIDPAGSDKVLEKLSIINKSLYTTAGQSSDKQEKLLSSINELKAAMIGSADRVQLGWQKTILENPAFRAMTTFSQMMKTVVRAPFKAMFGIRGGFLGDVRKATRTSNIYQQQVNLLALIYTKGMTFLRNIDKYTKVTAEALVGEEVSPTSSKTYTLFGKIKEFMTTRSIGGLKGNAFNNFAESLNLDKSALRDAGIKSFADLLSPGAILKNMGFTKTNIIGKFREGPDAAVKDAHIEAARNAMFDTQFAARGYKKRFDASATGKKMSSMYATGAGVAGEAGAWAKEKGEWAKGKGIGIGDWAKGKGVVASEWGKNKGGETWDTAKTWKGRMVEELSKIRKAQEDREDREGPHSPSMAENVASTTVAAIKGNKLTRALTKKIAAIKKSIFKTAKEMKHQYKKNYKNEMEKQKKLAEIRKASIATKRSVQESVNIGKKNRKDAKGWIPMIWGFFMNMATRFGKLLNTVKNLSMFFLGPFFKMFKFLTRGIGKVFGKGGSGILTGLSGKLGKAAGGIRGAYAGGGVRAVGGFAARGGLKVAGTALGAAGGIVTGGTMALWDMAQAIMSGDEKGFVGNFITRGLAGFIGGTDTGAKGAMSGAMKGAGLGAAIGSVVPGVGTLIGGAIGGAAGMILGFVGGPKISEGIKNSMSGIADIAKAIWKIAIFPFQVVREVIQSISLVLKFAAKKVWNWLDKKLSGPGFIGNMWEKFKNLAGIIGGAISKLFSFIGNSIKNLFSVDKLKQMIYDFLFPIPRLVAALKNIGNTIDTWLSGLPLIGRAYKWAKRSVKSIQSGDMSASLERALEGKPQVVTNEQRDKLTAEEIAKLYSDKEGAKQQAEEDRMKRQTEERNKNDDKNTDKSNAVTVQTTNVNSSNSSSVNNNGGGQRRFPSTKPRYTTSSEALAGGLAGGNI